MTLSTNSDIEIYIKKKVPSHQIISDLAKHLDIDLKHIHTNIIDHQYFWIKCKDNRYDGVPAAYVHAGIKSHFFDHRMVVTFNTNHFQNNLDLIVMILRFFWDQKIPAATHSSDVIEDQLPWLGGNDVRKIFWKDEKFTEEAFINLCSSNPDWQHVLKDKA